MPSHPQKKILPVIYFLSFLIGLKPSHATLCGWKNHPYQENYAMSSWKEENRVEIKLNFMRKLRREEKKRMTEMKRDIMLERKKIMI